MSESTKALNYVLNQLKQHAVGQYPMSAGRASQLINEAVKLQYPLRKVDDTFVPPSALDWGAAQVLNDAFDTQPKGCTSATPVCAPAIFPQAERDDWFTQRIDPYDDRIRYLERFVHGLKAAGVGGK